MKRIILLFFAVISVFSAYGQTYLEEGDRCFDNGDYACAETKYNEAFKLVSGKDKQIAEIKLTRAKNCSEWIKAANQAFSNGNYSTAKEGYQKVLDSNPKDTNAKQQLEKCETALNPIQTVKANPNNAYPNTQLGKNTTQPLRKAIATDLADIWNNKYGVEPERSQRLIAAGIDPDDARSRINAGDGKPISNVGNPTPEKGKPATNITLSVPKQNLSFFASGGRTTMEVNTNAGDYQITNLPSWCKINNKFSDWFSITCDPNYTKQPRYGWFVISAGGKEVRIYINQESTAPATAQKSSTAKTTKNNTYKRNNPYKSKSYSCFNCPQTKYPVGFSVGYVEKNLVYSINNENINANVINYDFDKLQGIQAGFRIEPLFKYGFGLNMGVFYEFYSKSIEQSYNYSDYYDNYIDIYTVNYKQHIINIPLHLEYRFNFSKYFSLFIYGGASIDIPVSDDFSSSTYALFDYGGGLRIDHVQFNIGKSNIISDISNSTNYDLFSNKYKNLEVSMSYMF